MSLAWLPDVPTYTLTGITFGVVPVSLGGDMPTIDSLPNKSTFGTLFDYSVWGPGTEVTLCNVPWDSMYRDVYWFDKPEQIIKYIHDYNSHQDIPTTTIKNLTYCAQGVPVRISIPFSEANTFNYLIVQNSAFPISQSNRATTFFYFIQSVDYVAPETTQLTISLDVWQTYHHLINFGDAFVERGHMLEWKEKEFRYANSDGGKWLEWSRNWLLANESFDLGSRHMIYRSWLTSMNDDYQQYKYRYDFTAVIVSTVDMTWALGTKDNPIMKVAPGSIVQYMGANDTMTGAARPDTKIVSGAVYYQCPLDKLCDVMKSMREAPWVAQGILDIYIVPKPNITVTPMTSEQGKAGMSQIVSLFTAKHLSIEKEMLPAHHIQHFGKRHILTDRHRQLLERFTKFFLAPYCFYEISANNGQTITVSSDQQLTPSLVLRTEFHLLPPAPRIVAHLADHNSVVPDGRWKGDVEYVNEAIVIDNFPHVPVVNDQSTLWYASNAHSIAQSRSAASWGMDKSIRAAQNSFDATMRGIGTSNAIMENNLGAQNLNTALANTAQMAHQQVNSANRAISGIGGAVGTALTNPLKGIGQLGGYVQGQITSDISTGIDINARNMGNVISQNTTRANQMEQNGLATANANANRNLANWAASGDYQQQIGALNASIKDSMVTPPSVSGATGGDAFNWLINGAVFQTRMRMVSPEVILKQGEYWERYGYAVNRFISKLPDRLRCMTRFTYWKCTAVRATSSAVPQVYVETVRGILEKGVTVWHQPPAPDEHVQYVATINRAVNWS